jgi:hypothetical protein
LLLSYCRCGMAPFDCAAEAKAWTVEMKPLHLLAGFFLVE